MGIIMDSFEFELRDKRQQRSRCLGFSILAISVLSGSLLGCMLNLLDCQGALLKMAWRFQSAFLLMIFIIPTYLCCLQPNDRQFRPLRQKAANQLSPSDGNEVLQSFRSYEEKYP